MSDSAERRPAVQWAVLAKGVGVAMIELATLLLLALVSWGVGLALLAIV